MGAEGAILRRRERRERRSPHGEPRSRAVYVKKAIVCSGQNGRLSWSTVKQAVGRVEKGREGLE
eukprot:scaffold299211_cov28-Tisochrysis_lutea.AAC.4